MYGYTFAFVVPYNQSVSFPATILLTIDLTFTHWGAKAQGLLITDLCSYSGGRASMCPVVFCRMTLPVVRRPVK